MTIGLVVSYRINMQPSSLSNRVTTDRKDLRELLERTVLEWVHNKSLVPYLVKLFSHHTQKNIPSNPGSILYVIFPLLILSHTILFSFRVWLVPLVLLAHLDPTAPRWEYQHYPLDCKIKMSSVESEYRPNSCPANQCVGVWSMKIHILCLLFWMVWLTGSLLSRVRLDLLALLVLLVFVVLL